MCLHGMCSAPTDCAPSKAVACAIRLLHGRQRAWRLLHAWCPRCSKTANAAGMTEGRLWYGLQASHIFTTVWWRKTIPLCAKESPATCMGRRRIMSTCVGKDHSLQNSSSGFRNLSRVSATNGKFPLIDTSRLMSIIMFYHPKFKTKDFVANK